MDDIIAIKIKDKVEGETGFLTFGRIFDRVDDKEIVSVVKSHCHKYGIDDIESIELCWQIQDVSHMRYFYEAFYSITQEKIPTNGKDYEEWVNQKKQSILYGDDIFFLGFKK